MPLAAYSAYCGLEGLAAAAIDTGRQVREYVTDDAGTISKVIIPSGQTGAGTYLVTWNGHGDAMALHKLETNGTRTLANSYTRWFGSRGILRCLIRPSPGQGPTGWPQQPARTEGSRYP